MRPQHFTNRPRKYLAGRFYKTAGPVSIFRTGQLPAGTRFSATGQLGSTLYEPKKGKRHPEDLLIEVRKLRGSKQSHVYDAYWIPAWLFYVPGLILNIRKRRTKEKIRRSIDRAARQIESIGRPVQPSSR